MKQYHFVTGLPRSGSTLLCAMLSQNPDFYVTPTSGLCDVIADTNRNWEQYEAHKMAPRKSTKRNVLKRIIDGYFEDAGPSHCFDKNRGWLRYIKTLRVLLNTPKIIVTVRDMPGVVASWEKLYLKNEAFAELPVDANQQCTIENRVNYYLRGEGTTYFSYCWLKSCFEKGLLDDCLLIDFDALTHEPDSQLDLIYRYLKLDRYSHDLVSIPQYTHEADPEPWMAGLHEIKDKVVPSQKPVSVIPDEIIQKVDNQYPCFWGDLI